MEQVRCPQCEQSFSPSLDVCPKCGAASLWKAPKPSQDQRSKERHAGEENAKPRGNPVHLLLFALPVALFAGFCFYAYFWGLDFGSGILLKGQWRALIVGGFSLLAAFFILLAAIFQHIDK